MADSIAVMNRGRIVQRGSARDLVERPATRFIADFVGPTNIFAGTLYDATTFACEDGIVARLATPAAGIAHVGIRPERMRMRPVTPVDTTPAPNAVRGTLVEHSYRAATRVSLVALANGRLVTVTQGVERLVTEIASGDEVILEWDAASVVPLADA